jgi:5,10-methylenetetrahydromethanopterin reductase
MRIGITVGLGARSERTIAGLIERAEEVERSGFASLWMPAAFGFDAITALVAIGARTTRLEIGTAVVPTFPRHPVVMAQQALTAQAALDGRFTLGIGLSHKVMMEDSLGLPFEHPAAHLAEYLAVLAPLLAGQPVAFEGDEYRVDAAVDIEGAAPVPLLVAAMGPLMLRLAGRLTDGTITSWVGPRTLDAHIVPTIHHAAAASGRPEPRIAVGLPIMLTDDADGARARLGSRAAWYSTLPSYAAMFEREGVDGPAGVALIGDEAALDAGLDRLRDAGATDYLAQIMADDTASASRTFDYLTSRCAN